LTRKCEYSLWGSIPGPFEGWGFIWIVPRGFSLAISLQLIHKMLFLAMNFFMIAKLLLSLILSDAWLLPMYIRTMQPRHQVLLKVVTIVMLMKMVL
jgi:hypothetical protein